MLRLGILAWALLLFTCRHVPVSTQVSTLAGSTVRLKSNPSLQLTVEGAVDGVPADVQFDVASKMTSVTPSCLNGWSVMTRVAIENFFGLMNIFPITRMTGFTLGAFRFPAINAALAAGKGCTVVLGTDMLNGLAIEVSPTRREVHFRPSQTRAAWAAELLTANADTQLLSLSRTLKHDWPLLPVRLKQSDRSVVLTLLVSSRHLRSRLFETTAKNASLVTLANAPSPAGAAPTQPNALPWQSIELFPHFAVADGIMGLLPGSSPYGIAGILGTDVWGRFETTFDVGSGLLILRRPHLHNFSKSIQCKHGNNSLHTRCFELHTRKHTNGSFLLTATAWHPLPHGAHLVLDAPNMPCELGFTFPPSPRGYSTQHTVPSKQLHKDMPECAAAVSNMRPVTWSRYEAAETHPQCPGWCTFARHFKTGRISCSCLPNSEGTFAWQLLQRYRQTQKDQPVPQEVEPME